MFKQDSQNEKSRSPKSNPAEVTAVESKVMGDGFNHAVGGFAEIIIDDKRYDAQFVVKAINSHEALVNALEYALEVTDADMATGKYAMSERAKESYAIACAALAGAK